MKRCSQYLYLIREMDNRWRVGPIIVMLGYVRTVINEFLRRIVHLIYRIVG